MKDQHKKISGYRDLSEDEIASMNRVKALEGELAACLDALEDIPGVDLRDLALARTHFEDGCIRAVRAVARPVSPWVKG